ncbi:FAD-dependent oxidoreductase [Acuticoccus sp. M5D2P5]|uniref:FAD-dependent oxidoreductase n=1 Tax=Acuticoccus kalidii TaxID=2910977 RepID=UPI001F1E2368|nr:FAD-dependent oxidoreductase [Acuticoccus kalidii]MCF3935217.1 FAD-dependent oxidoreductase [Acuticoccus kalidii]
MAPIETDVCVVGAGGAGLAAAIGAGRAGARVVLLEKGATPGGTTGRSVGSITASGTRWQKAAGVDDTTDAHFEDMALFAGPRAERDNLTLRRFYVENAGETVHFLADLGIEFIGPMPEPPHRVPRMHNIVPHSRAYISQLLREARRLGVTVMTETSADEVLMEGGHVTGLRATARSGPVEIKASAVILASGDYSSSPDIKRKLGAAQAAEIEGVNPLSTGDGQRIGEAAGGHIVNGDIVWGPEIRFVAPPKPKLIAKIPPSRPFAKLVKASFKAMPDRLLRPFLMSFVTTYLAPSHTLFSQGAILVNRDGARFCDERDGPQDAIPQQTGREAFILLDKAIAERFEVWPNFISTAPGVAYAYLADYRRNRRDITFEGDTLEAVAGKAGVDPAGLAHTVAAYNADADARGERPALSGGPYTILGPARSFILMTEGGLAVNTDLQVLGADDAPIDGLFAAGSAGQGGLILDGHGHHLGWAFTSGRIAGANAARSIG